MREMFLYPWDALDEGIDVLTDRLQQWRIQSVSIAGIYHQARMLLPHNPRRRLMVHPGSSCYFPFDPSRYGVLVPRSPDPTYAGLWQKLVSALSQRGIGVTAWCVLMHSTYQCRQHPQLAITSILGDRSPNSLCPSHSDVQDYVCSLARDLKASGVDQMDAESLDYAGFLHGDHHEMQAYADTFTLNRLLGLCFCEACQARARARGIDVDALMRQVRAAADAFLLCRPAPAIDPDLLSAYDVMRCDTIAQLTQRMQAESGVTIRPILGLAEGAAPVQSGVDLVRQGIGEAIVCYPSSPEATAAFVQHARAHLPGHARMTGGIRLMHPQTTAAAQGPAFEAAYASAGVEDVIYYNYGMAPLPMLEALGRPLP